MSTVFLAERVDGTFERQAVIKVVCPGMESRSTLRRQSVERQILAIQAGLDLRRDML